MLLRAVEVVDRHPIQRGVEVLLHLSHGLAGEGFEVPELDPALGRHDEPELVPVLQPAIAKGPGIGAIVLARVGLTALAVGRDAVALQIALALRAPR